MMTEMDLISQIAALESQIDTLVAENRRLRELLHENNAGNIEQVDKKMIRASVPAQLAGPRESSMVGTDNTQPDRIDHIDLFLSLFRGRPNVYARRCYSQKDSAAFYMPTCGNRNIRGVCERPRIKCGVCENGAPISRKVVEHHLKNAHEHGDGIIGVYPLLKEDACYFLAIDFDGSSWMEDIGAFRAACKGHDIPVSVERSRSGDGGHVWIFFDAPVPAVEARKMGSGLLTESMTVRHEIRFASYDRTFPNQDLLPENGLGNLIALPLQGGPAKIGNSLFVDEGYQAYDDQWAYLSKIRKMTADEVRAFNAISQSTAEPDDLAKASFNDEESSKPWERKKQTMPLSDADVHEDLTVIEANMLYVKKDGVGQRALSRIKRLAAFFNPEYFKKQRMRISTKGTPIIVSSLDETSEYLGIPRGCREALVELIKPTGAAIIFLDKRNHGRPIHVQFTGELREDQSLAEAALSQHEAGVLAATTAFGKTVIGAALIAHHQCSTLVIVHLQTLLLQWKNTLNQFLTINEELPPISSGRGRKKKPSLIGQIGGGKNEASGIVDIAIIQSLCHANEVMDIVKDYGMVIVDECHHVPAVNFERVLKAVNARYVYGLTATPKRQDGQHPLIYMQCGPSRYIVDAKSQAAKRGFEHYVTPCFTAFKKPLALTGSEWTIGRIYSDIGKDEYRNRQIATDVLDAVAHGRTPIILTQRKEHVAILAGLLDGQCGVHIVQLTGGGSNKLKKSVLDTLATIPEDERLIVIATGKYAGEGFDCPRLDTLFLAMPVAWEGLLAQYAGRLHREYPGKQDVIIYDYVDVHVEMLERMHHKRVSAYSKIGYRTIAGHNQEEQANVIYDSHSFEAVIRNDLEQAKGAILIVSPFILQRRTQAVLEWLSAPMQQNSKLTVIVVTRPVEAYKIKDRQGVQTCINTLKSANICVLQRPNVHQKFVVIDDVFVWYGSINLLSYGKNAEESIMRLESREIALELSGLVGD